MLSGRFGFFLMLSVLFQRCQVVPTPTGLIVYKIVEFETNPASNEGCQPDY
jgi:hypothetical protein